MYALVGAVTCTSTAHAGPSRRRPVARVVGQPEPAAQLHDQPPPGRYHRSRGSSNLPSLTAARPTGFAHRPAARTGRDRKKPPVYIRHGAGHLGGDRRHASRAPCCARARPSPAGLEVRVRPTWSSSPTATVHGTRDARSLRVLRQGGGRRLRRGARDRGPAGASPSTRARSCRALHVGHDAGVVSGHPDAAKRPTPGQSTTWRSSPEWRCALTHSTLLLARTRRASARRPPPSRCRDHPRWRPLGSARRHDLVVQRAAARHAPLRHATSAASVYRARPSGPASGLGTISLRLCTMSTTPVRGRVPYAVS